MWVDTGVSTGNRKGERQWELLGLRRGAPKQGLECDKIRRHLSSEQRLSPDLPSHVDPSNSPDGQLDGNRSCPGAEWPLGNCSFQNATLALKACPASVQNYNSRGACERVPHKIPRLQFPEFWPLFVVDSRSSG